MKLSLLFTIPILIAFSFLGYGQDVSSVRDTIYVYDTLYVYDTVYVYDTIEVDEGVNMVDAAPGVIDQSDKVNTDDNDKPDADSSLVEAVVRSKKDEEDSDDSPITADSDSPPVEPNSNSDQDPELSSTMAKEAESDVRAKSDPDTVTSRNEELKSVKASKKTKTKPEVQEPTMIEEDGKTVATVRKLEVIQTENSTELGRDISYGTGIGLVLEREMSSRLFLTIGVDYVLMFRSMAPTVAGEFANSLYDQGLDENTSLSPFYQAYWTHQLRIPATVRIRFDDWSFDLGVYRSYKGRDLQFEIPGVYTVVPGELGVLNSVSWGWILGANRSLNDKWKVQGSLQSGFTAFEVYDDLNSIDGLYRLHTVQLQFAVERYLGRSKRTIPVQ